MHDAGRDLVGQREALHHVAREDAERQPVLPAAGVLGDEVAGPVQDRGALAERRPRPVALRLLRARDRLLDPAASSGPP
jgi:hypothetical protein